MRGNDTYTQSTTNASNGNGVVDERAYHMVRKVDSIPLSFANHSFILFILDNPNDFTDKQKLQKQGISNAPFTTFNNGEIGVTIGGFKVGSNLVSRFNESNDVREANNFLVNGKKSVRDVKWISHSKSDTEFGYELLKANQNYIHNTNAQPLSYGATTFLPNDFNCNCFSNSILDYVGADKKRSRDFNWLDVGTTKQIPRKYFNPEFVK